MSYVYYLASDTELDELENPYIAYEKGRVILTTFFAEFYPRVFYVDKKVYEHLPITGKHVLGLDFRWREDTVEILIQYMRKHLTKADEIELLSVWLDGNKNIKSKKISSEQLDYSFLDRFLDEDENPCDIKKLTVVNQFYYTRD